MHSQSKPLRISHPMYPVQMCVCVNNMVGTRKQLKELCCVMGINGDAFGTSSAHALRVIDSGDDTLAEILHSMRKDLDLAFNKAVEAVASSVCVMVSSSFLCL